MLAGWALSRLTAPKPGSMEDLYARVRVGMTQAEALAALKFGGAQSVDCLYAEGTDRQGNHFLSGLSFANLPQASEYRELEVEVTCVTGESVKVTFGEGGVVTTKQYLADDWCYRRLHQLHQAFGH
jgi:hypothetical protein